MTPAPRIYASKAELYARYRWDYAPEAIAAICSSVELDERSVVADLGAGTGILTRHFGGREGLACALEPDFAMARQAARTLRDMPGCPVVTATAEACGLASGSVDLACAAQAVHWFQPEPALAEMRRILKPGGWLALLSNRPLDGPALGQAIQGLDRTEFGYHPASAPQPGADTPADFYFAPGWQQLSFPFGYEQTWEEFLGSLLSASYAPLDSDACYDAYEAQARAIFARFSRQGLLERQAETRLWIGRVRRS
jgi:SAM-dependent methyltransferase